MHCLGVSGGISVKTGFEEERFLSDGDIEIIVDFEKPRASTVGGMLRQESFFYNQDFLF